MDENCIKKFAEFYIAWSCRTERTNLFRHILDICIKPKHTADATFDFALTDDIG